MKTTEVDVRKHLDTMVIENKDQIIEYLLNVVNTLISDLINNNGNVSKDGLKSLRNIESPFLVKKSANAEDER